jgi:glyoxalase family protein
VLAFTDPGGLPCELVGCEDPRRPLPWGDVERSAQLRGFHSVTLHSRLPELTLDFLTSLLRLRVTGSEGNRTRVTAGAVDGAAWIDVVDEPRLPWGSWGLGGLHHVALTVETKGQMEQLWRVLSGAGLIVTDLRDRKWFHSMYFTEPGGINLEISDLAPGWTVDEPAEDLGGTLCLPRQWEDQRSSIEARLPSLAF